jgi:two-component system, NtrC family, response regulator AtoC
MARTGEAKESGVDDVAAEAVLVVDDDEAVCVALRDVLHEAGYKVATARNGEQALVLLSAVTPDIFLVDLMMPVMDGWGLVAQLRADARLRSIPVVVMTAGGTSALARAPVAAGYLAKPLKLDQLLQTLARSLAMNGEMRASGVRRMPAF